MQTNFVSSIGMIPLNSESNQSKSPHTHINIKYSGWMMNGFEFQIGFLSQDNVQKRKLVFPSNAAALFSLYCQWNKEAALEVVTSESSCTTHQWTSAASGPVYTLGIHCTACLSCWKYYVAFSMQYIVTQTTCD